MIGLKTSKRVPFVDTRAALMLSQALSGVPAMSVVYLLRSLAGPRLQSRPLS